MSNVEDRYGPVIEVFEVEGTRERRLVIGYRMRDTANFFRLTFFYMVNNPILTDPSSALSNLYHFYSLYSSRKYVGKSLMFLSRFLLNYKPFPRAIFQWDNHHISIPKPPAQLRRSPD